MSDRLEEIRAEMPIWPYVDNEEDLVWLIAEVVRLRSDKQYADNFDLHSEIEIKNEQIQSLQSQLAQLEKNHTDLIAASDGYNEKLAAAEKELDERPRACDVSAMHSERDAIEGTLEYTIKNLEAANTELKITLKESIDCMHLLALDFNFLNSHRQISFIENANLREQWKALRDKLLPNYLTVSQLSEIYTMVEDQ